MIMSVLVLMMCLIPPPVTNEGQGAQLIQLGDGQEGVELAGHLRDLESPCFLPDCLPARLRFSLTDAWHPKCGGRISYRLTSENNEIVRAAYATLLTAVSTEKKVRFKVRVLGGNECSDLQLGTLILEAGRRE